MRHAQFVGEVVARTGLGEEQAHQAIGCCLKTLASGLSDMATRKLRQHLPAEFHLFLVREGPVRDLSPDEFVQCVANTEGVRVGLGLEHAEVVLQTVFHAVDQETLHVLHGELPPRLVEMGHTRPSYHPPPPRPVPPPMVQRRTSSGTSLAEGRPTSARPLSGSGREGGNG